MDLALFKLSLDGLLWLLSFVIIWLGCLLVLDTSSVCGKMASAWGCLLKVAGCLDGEGLGCQGKRSFESGLLRALELFLVKTLGTRERRDLSVVVTAAGVALVFGLASSGGLEFRVHGFGELLQDFGGVFVPFLVPGLADSFDVVLPFKLDYLLHRLGSVVLPDLFPVVVALVVLRQVLEVVQ